MIGQKEKEKKRGELNGFMNYESQFPWDNSGTYVNCKKKKENEKRGQIIHSDLDFHLAVNLNLVVNNPEEPTLKDQTLIILCPVIVKIS